MGRGVSGGSSEQMAPWFSVVLSGLNWSPGLQRLLSASVSQWQQVCRAGSKLVQAWDPYLMNDSLANGPPFTGFHCGDISRFLSYPTQKTCPALLVFIGFDWFGILKRVGFCAILYVWTLVHDGCVWVYLCVDGGVFLGGGCIFLHFCLLNWWAQWSHGTVSGMM